MPIDLLQLSFFPPLLGEDLWVFAWEPKETSRQFYMLIQWSKGKSSCPLKEAFLQNIPSSKYHLIHLYSDQGMSRHIGHRFMELAPFAYHPDELP